MKRLPHVALLIETSREYGRSLLRGILRYQTQHGPWSFFLQPRGICDPVPNWLEKWKGDGILARIEDPAAARIIEGTGIPAVDLRFNVPDLKIPAVGVDNRTIVPAAIDHFISRGFRRLAFCGYPTGLSHCMDFRRDLFFELARQQGFECEDFPTRRTTWSWEQDQADLVRWLDTLKKPVAILAYNDERGLQLLDACRRANVRVPEDVAVMGVDNDEFLCGVANPPMTSIDISLDRVGYQAAQVLDSMMKGEPAPTAPVIMQVGRVVSRRSTDIYAVENPELRQALSYLRANACKGLRIEDLSRAVSVERRTLERRMKQFLGRSLKEEVLRVQLEEAQRLLIGSDLSIKKVAASVGFSNSRYFSEVFQRKFGLAPKLYRLQQSGN
ncbi:substrate-binding domain-containing protein [Planctomicrobium sp. SH664]|uniref:XylR family transcriptional regulator n=1 Tax=Planctomicrobium sp. SH664 TaxID=3448125 RepID=UPI003F5C804F